MRFRRVSLIALALSWGLLSFASTPMRLEDPAENPGFVHFYNLEFDEALADFSAQLKAHPDDPDAYNHVAQTILYREMYRDGALESQLVSGTNPFLRRAKMEVSAADKKQFNQNIDESIRLSDAILKRDPRDAQALYASSVAHGLRANYYFLVEKKWMAALHESIAGRRANDELLAIDSNFVDAHLISGVSHYIVGCLPFYLRALGSVNGFHGDKEGGVRELQLVAKQGVLNRYDAEVLLAAIYRRERRPKDAIPILQDVAGRFPRNYIFRFEQVQMYSDMGDKRAALDVIGQIEDLRRSGAPGYREICPEKIRYLEGNLLFWYGDLDPALVAFKQVTQKANSLDLSTAVMAWLRLGQVYDLQGRRSDAIEAYRKTVETAPQSEPAQEAQGYISNPYRRKRVSG
ncbi:MAG: tetratricopeptide repeat protein [Acidobacteriaceae bacterium]|nr:tetratricopeptide repeat protein [Acidobacteriaceae bacterium]